MNRRQLIFSGFLIFIASFFFFIQDSCYVPSSDDMFYKFVCNNSNNGQLASEIGEGTQYIENISDVVKSMNWFYCHINGRYIVHFLVQYFTALVSHNVFSIINALFYALLLLFIYKLSVADSNKYSLETAVICVTFSWFLIPFQGLSFLGGVATSVNYLWSGVFFLIFLYLHKRVKSNWVNISFYKTALLFFFGAFAGSLQESYFLGLSCVFFIYFIIFIKKTCLAERALLLGLFVGTVVCVLAPGNFIRFSQQGDSGSASSFLFGMLSSWGIDVLLASTILMFFININYLYAFIRRNWILIGTILFNSLFCAFIAYNGRHQLTCISICSIILTIRLWSGIRLWSRVVIRSLAVALFLGLIASHIYVYQIRLRRYESFTNFCKEALKTSNDYISCREYEDVNYILANSPFVCNYYINCIQFVCMNGMKKALSLSLSHGNNMNLFDKLYPDEPNSLAAMCSYSNRVADNTYRIRNNYYVVALDHQVPTSAISARIKVKRRAFFLSDTYETIRPKVYFSNNGMHYYILGNRGELEPIIGIEKVMISSL